METEKCIVTGKELPLLKMTKLEEGWIDYEVYTNAADILKKSNLKLGDIQDTIFNDDIYNKLLKKLLWSMRKYSKLTDEKEMSLLNKHLELERIYCIKLYEKEPECLNTRERIELLKWGLCMFPLHLVSEIKLNDVGGRKLELLRDRYLDKRK